MTHRSHIDGEIMCVCPDCRRDLVDDLIREHKSRTPFQGFTKTQLNDDMDRLFEDSMMLEKDIAEVDDLLSSFDDAFSSKEVYKKAKRTSRTASQEAARLARERRADMDREMLRTKSYFHYTPDYSTNVDSDGYYLRVNKTEELKREAAEAEIKAKETRMAEARLAKKNADRRTAAMTPSALEARRRTTSDYPAPDLVARERILNRMFNDPERVANEGPGYWRFDNMIAVAACEENERFARETVSDTLARGLAAMGASVLVVNHPDYATGRATNPVATNVDNLYAVNVSEDEHYSRAVRPDAPWKDFSRQFDYVITCMHWGRSKDDTYRSSQSTSAHDPYLYAGRFIYCGQGVASTRNDDVLNRSFYIAASRIPTALYIDNRGNPQALGSAQAQGEAYNIIPGDINIPVVALCAPNTDPQEVAKAAIGVGDSKQFYITPDMIKPFRRGVAMRRAFSFRNPSEWVIVPGAIAMMGIGGFMGAQAALGVPLGTAVVASGIAGIGTWLTRMSGRPIRQMSKKAIESRAEKDIQPPTVPVRYEISAPPLGVKHDDTQTLTGPMYMSDMLWERICARHQDIKNRWSAYELDISKMLEAPLIVDYSVEQTAALAKAMRKADDLKTAVDDERARGGRSIPVVRGLFAEAVTDLEVAFEVAEAHAQKMGITGFTEHEQKKIERSKQLFTIALSASSADQEREVALGAARRELKGVLSIPQTTIAFIESSVRKEITSGTDSVVD